MCHGIREILYTVYIYTLGVYTDRGAMDDDVRVRVRRRDATRRTAACDTAAGGIVPTDATDTDTDATRRDADRLASTRARVPSR